jgi:hypothetical protein
MYTEKSISEETQRSQNMLIHPLANYKCKTKPTIYWNVIRRNSQQSKKTATIKKASQEQCELV